MVNNTKKIIFFGNYINERLIELKHDSAVCATFKWQKNMIDELKKKIDVQCYSLALDPFFPKIKEIWIPTKKEIIRNKDSSSLFRYINLPFFRGLFVSLEIIVICLYKKTIKQEKICIMQYNLGLSYLIPCFILNKIFNIKFIPVILDIFTDLEINGNKLTLRKIIFKIQTWILKKLSKVIVINEKIAEDFGLKDYLVIEGGIIIQSKNDFKILKKEKKEKKEIIFTGRLDEVNGIKFCIDSFNKINKELNLELHFYGDGPLVDYIKIKNKENDKIKYKGFLCQNDILKIQKKADFLIIPRKKSLKILRYTFPSKIFEYMLSGTPVIMTDIPGLKSEYKDNLFVINTEDEIEFAKYIEKIISLECKVLNQKASKAQEFLLKTKQWKNQAEKIENYLK